MITKKFLLKKESETHKILNLMQDDILSLPALD